MNLWVTYLLYLASLKLIKIYDLFNFTKENKNTLEFSNTLFIYCSF